jgi:hypothetical protein
MYVDVIGSHYLPSRALVCESATGKTTPKSRRDDVPLHNLDPRQPSIKVSKGKTTERLGRRSKNTERLEHRRGLGEPRTTFHRNDLDDQQMHVISPH